MENLNRCFKEIVDVVFDLPFIIECLKRENINNDKIPELIYEFQKKVINEKRGILKSRQKKFLLKGQINKLLKEVRSDKYIFTSKKELNEFIENLTCGCHLFGVFSSYIPDMDDDIYIAIAGRISDFERIDKEKCFYISVVDSIKSFFESDKDYVKVFDFPFSLVKLNLPMVYFKYYYG